MLAHKQHASEKNWENLSKLINIKFSADKNRIADLIYPNKIILAEITNSF